MSVWGMSVIRSVRRQLRRIVARRPVRDDLLAQRVENCAATAAEALALAKSCERKTAAIVANVGETAAIAGVPMIDNDRTSPRLEIVSGELCGDVAAVAVAVVLLAGQFLLDAEPDGFAPVGEGLLLLGS
jgi:hypothetical protein